MVGDVAFRSESSMCCSRVVKKNAVMDLVRRACLRWQLSRLIAYRTVLGMVCQRSRCKAKAIYEQDCSRRYERHKNYPPRPLCTSLHQPAGGNTSTKLTVWTKHHQDNGIAPCVAAHSEHDFVELIRAIVHSVCSCALHVGGFESLAQ